MEKEFLPYAEALELKELGFNEPCLGCFENDEEDSFYLFEKGFIENTNDYYNEEVCAPLYQQAFNWFRVKYDLRTRNYGVINYSGGLSEYFEIYKYAKGTVDKILSIQVGSLSYEKAELECLKKLIEIVKDLAVAE